MSQDTDDYAEVAIGIHGFSSLIRTKVILKDIFCPQKRENEIRDHIQEILFKEKAIVEIFLRDSHSKVESKITVIAGVHFNLTGDIFIEEGLREHSSKVYRKNLELAYESKNDDSENK